MLIANRAKLILKLFFVFLPWTSGTMNLNLVPVEAFTARGRYLSLDINIARSH